MLPFNVLCFFLSFFFSSDLKHTHRSGALPRTTQQVPGAARRRGPGGPPGHSGMIVTNALNSPRGLSLASPDSQQDPGTGTVLSLRTKSFPKATSGSLPETVLLNQPRHCKAPSPRGTAAGSCRDTEAPAGPRPPDSLHHSGQQKQLWTPACPSVLPSVP